MTKIIVIKMKGKRIKSYTNTNDASVAYMLNRLCKNPAQIKTRRRTKAKLGFLSCIKRLGYVFKSIKFAFSKDFYNAEI